MRRFATIFATIAFSAAMFAVTFGPALADEMAWGE
jgi:hypothetical protein